MTLWEEEQELSNYSGGNEVPNWGSQGEQILKLLNKIPNLTSEEELALTHHWDTQWVGSSIGEEEWLDVSEDIGMAATLTGITGVWSSLEEKAYKQSNENSWCAIRDALSALLMRDKLSSETYDSLTTPWRKVVGSIHSDDMDIYTE